MLVVKLVMIFALLILALLEAKVVWVNVGNTTPVEG